MISSYGYAAHAPGTPLEPFRFERRGVGAQDILIETLYCGVCHSDIHQVNDDWQGSIFPMVPGHEIVGKVVEIGKEVKKFKIGDTAAVGCMVDSCQRCTSCEQHLEQYCQKGFVATYNSYQKDGKTPTYGGYSNNIVVHEDFALTVDSNLTLANTAPLLCAGITTYSPLRHWNIGKRHHVGIMGLGGLGHMAVKIAHALGANVTVLTTSSSKAEDAHRLGANDVILSSENSAMLKHNQSFDFLINTISAPIDLGRFMQLLKHDGTMVMLGIPGKPTACPTADLIFKRRAIAGSLIGGIQETQEMLDFCAKHNITSDIEIIDMTQINAAYQRMLKGDVKYRFVIDIAKT